MASGWAVTKLSEDDTFEFKWNLPNFQSLLKRNDSVFSDVFDPKMSDFPWKLFLCISRTEIPCENSDDETSEDDDAFDFLDGLPSKNPRYPEEVEIDGVMVPITSFFNVQLCVQNRDVSPEQLDTLELSGKLTITQKMESGVENIIKGRIFEVATHDDDRNDDRTHKIRTGFVRFGHGESPARYPMGYKSQGWYFGTKSPTFRLTKYCTWEWGMGGNGEKETKIYHDFYTLGKMSQLTLNATIAREGQVTSTSGTVEQKEVKGLDLRRLLEQPRFSDFTIVCEGQTFPCHRAILANR